MRIAIMGAGALGGYVGGRLAACGNDVVLIARGAHLEAIRKDGLFVKSPKGDLHLPQIHATDDPVSVGVVDYILFFVKNFDVKTSAIQMTPMIGADTAIITFQNGVSAPEIVACVTGSDNVLPGVIRFPADIKSPGVVRHSAPIDIVIFGERAGGSSPRCAAIAEQMAKANLMVRVADDIMQELWEKMTMQASFASISALTRLDIGPIRENADCAKLFRAAMAEAEAVALAELPRLEPGMAKRQWEFLLSIPPAVHASMRDDLERGKRIEIDSLSGEIVALGKKHGIATPLHETFVSLLAPSAEGVPG